jgi:uncharacterized membrane protein
MENKYSGKAIASLVLGIVGVWWCITGVVGVVCGVLAVIFSVKAREEIKEKHLKGEGMSIAGLVCGIIGIVGGVVMTLIWLLMVVWGSCWLNLEVPPMEGNIRGI